MQRVRGTGAAWLVGLACLCMLGTVTTAVADTGIRAVSVTVVDVKSAPEGTLLFLDSAGNEVRATDAGEGRWILDIPATQRKVELWYVQQGVALKTGETALPGDANASLQVFVEPRGLRIQIMSTVAQIQTGAFFDPGATALTKAQLRQGGDVCASAVDISGALPISVSGTTVGYSDDYDGYNGVSGECYYSGSTSPDVVYVYTPTANVTVDMTLCTGMTDYDTKMYVWEGVCPDTGYLACIDDACVSAAGQNYVSEILDLALTGGVSYYIVIDGYGGASGNYYLDITEDVPPPPPPDCPADSLFAQPPTPSTGGWTAGVSDLRTGSGYSELIRYEDFSGAGMICDIHFWGLMLSYPWAACTEDPMDFEVIFYNDASGAPGTVACGPYTLTISGTDSGESWSGYPLYEFSADLAPCCNLASGWVSIQATSVGSPTDCWFLWGSHDETGLGMSLLYDSDLGWTTEDFDLSLCLTPPGVPIYGACCDDSTGICNDDIEMTQCSGRFEADTLCVDLVPPCGNPGACCDDSTAICVDDVLELDCTTRFAAGTLCADLDPACGDVTEPTGACCDPDTGDCYPEKTEYFCDLAFGPGNWLEGISCDPNPCIVTCEHSVVLTDDFGDGWNGGNIDLYVDGDFVDNYTLASGAGPVTYYFQAGTDDSIVTVYHAGSWSYENEYHIYDVNGYDICADGVGGETPVGCNTIGYCGPDPCEDNWPPNDYCEDATAVTGPYPKTVDGTNYCARVDCPGVLDWNATWWSIELPYASNNLNVSYCGNGFEINHVGAVYYNDCTDCSAFILYDEIDWYGCPDGITAPSLDWLEIPGPATVYFPVMFNYNSPVDYTITIDVTEIVLPENDLCENAIPVAVPSVTPGSTQGATTDYGYDCPGGSITSPGVWYSVTGTGNTMMADLCNGATTWDTKMTVICTECTDFQCVGANDDYCGVQSAVEWCSQYGANYLILVHGYGGQTGPFELTITDDGVPCEAEVMCLPVGACCMLDARCVITTELGCIANGGEYQGDDTDCGIPVGGLKAAAGPPRPPEAAIDWTYAGSSSGGRDDPTCPPGSLFAQPAQLTGWTAGTSDLYLGYIRAENFSGAGEICDIHWWALDLEFIDGVGWVECDDTDLTFEITFYSDAGGQPGAVVCGPYTVTPTKTFEADVGYDLWYYSVDLLDPCCTLASGWVSIQDVDNDSCSFLWMDSATGDDSSSLDDGTGWAADDFDPSLCLTGVPAYGACCDDYDGTCVDDVASSTCTTRFVADTLCADLVPPCGILGACCVDLACVATNLESECDPMGGTWYEGEDCATFECPATCDHTIVLTDDYGDGWNGGMVTVLVNGVPATPALTLASGSGPETYVFLAATGDAISTVYVPGSWAYENEYHVYDVGGFEICADGVGGTQPVGGDCGPGECYDTTSACCLPDGSCEDIMLADCEEAGGLSGGSGTECATYDCPEFMGACCLCDGSCVVTMEPCCDYAGGSFLGGGTDCGEALATVLSEDFNGGIPGDWTVIDDDGSGLIWHTNDYWGDANWTGGDGLCAEADSDEFGYASYDTSLISPVMDLSGAMNPVLDCEVNYQNFAGYDDFFIDVRTDGGAWINLLTWSEDHGTFHGSPGEHVTLALGVASANTQIRFRYYDPVTHSNWEVQVDDVVVTAEVEADNPCPQPAALDIKPGSCPNAFNPNSHGVLPVALMSTEQVDVTMVDISTVLMSRADGIGGSVGSHEGPPGPHSVYGDAATPQYPPCEGEACDCHELEGDGIVDLKMKFKTDDVVAALGVVEGGGPYELVVTGMLLDGTEFFASDCIRVVPPAVPGPGNGTLTVQSNINEAWVDSDQVDRTLDYGGFAEFVRYYFVDTDVTLTAEQTFQNRAFKRWVIDGVSQPLRVLTVQVTVDEDVGHNLVAEYYPRPVKPGHLGDTLPTTGGDLSR